jgi:hypothetical protein
MSFAGELLGSGVWDAGSGPPISSHARDEFSQGDTSTAEPISLAWKKLILDEILDVAASCSAEDWDGSGAAPISSTNVAKAFNLIYLAPAWIHPPDIVPSPDGEIAFEWQLGRERILALQPYGDDLIFSAILGPPNNRESGCKPLRAGWPDRILEILSEYFSNARPSSTSNC